MNRFIIIVIIFCALFTRARGQSPSASLDSLVKYKVINSKECLALQKEIKRLKGTNASYRYDVLGALMQISIQKKFHINTRATGFHISYSGEPLSQKVQDSTNTSLRLLLEKLSKANLLTHKVYSHTRSEIDSGRYLADIQMIGNLMQTTFRMEWLAPRRVLPVVHELHRAGIITDTSFTQLSSDINNDKIQSAIQLTNYCRYGRVFNMSKYPDDPKIWLEQFHQDISTILPYLKFTNFTYTEIPDTSFSIPGVRFKVSLTCNGRVYKYTSSALSSYRSKTGSVTPKDIGLNDFYRIFNKILTDQQSPYRLHSTMFTYAADDEVGSKRLALIALTGEQSRVFMQEPCINYMFTSLDSYDSTLTSAKIDSMLTGWRKAGLFTHLSDKAIEKGVDDAQSADFDSNLLSYFSEVVYNLHDELPGPNNRYRDLLVRIARLTHGAFNPTKITQVKLKRGVKLQYFFDGKVHSYVFPTSYGAFDVKFPTFLSNLGRENRLSGKFFTLLNEDVVIYLTSQQHNDIVKEGLLSLKPPLK